MDSSQLLAKLAQPLASLPDPSFSVSSALGGIAVTSTILASVRTVSGLPVARLHSLKATRSLVTQGAGLRERVHLFPERARPEASVLPLD